MSKRYLSKDGLWWCVVGAGAFLLVIAVLPFLFGFYARESVFCHRGSLDFRLLITEGVIRHFPTPQTTSQPNYYFSCGDGTKPPEQEVTFESTLDKDVLKKLTQAHIAKFGYTISSQEGDYTFWYSKANKSLFLEIESTNSASKVRASVIE